MNSRQVGKNGIQIHINDWRIISLFLAVNTLSPNSSINVAFAVQRSMVDSGHWPLTKNRGVK